MFAFICGVRGSDWGVVYQTNIYTQKLKCFLEKYLCKCFHPHSHKHKHTHTHTQWKLKFYFSYEWKIHVHIPFSEILCTEHNQTDRICFGKCLYLPKKKKMVRAAIDLNYEIGSEQMPNKYLITNDILFIGPFFFFFWEDSHVPCQVL